MTNCVDLQKEFLNLILSNFFSKDGHTFSLVCERNWADLPEEILGLIISNLFTKDRHTFSLVCKSWNRAALVSPFHPSPCLMFYEKSDCSWKFFQHIGFFSKKIPEIQDAEILYSNYEWLLMSRDRYCLFFFSPFNNHALEVPKIPIPYHILYFVNPPTSSNCIIVGMLSINTIVAIGTLKLGECKWKHYAYNCREPFVLSASSPILHRGLLYFLDVVGNVGTFNIERSGWTIHTNCPLAASLQGKLQQHFWIKLSDGEEEEEALLAVFVVGDAKKVVVGKLLGRYMKWALVKDLGNKMLCVSHTATFAKTAPHTWMRNKKNFAKFHGQSVIFYSLDTKKYHSIDGHYSNSKCCDLGELNFAAWILPPSVL